MTPWGSGAGGDYDGALRVVVAGGPLFADFAGDFMQIALTNRLDAYHAWYVLGTTVPSLLPRLIELLESPQQPWEVRDWTAAALARLTVASRPPPAELTALLEKALAQPDQDLGRLFVPAVAGATEFLEVEPPFGPPPRYITKRPPRPAQVACARVVLWTHAPSCAALREPIQQALAGTNVNPTLNALSLFSSWATPFVADLQRLTNHTDPAIRRGAAGILENLGPEPAPARAD